MALNIRSTSFRLLAVQCHSILLFFSLYTFFNVQVDIEFSKQENDLTIIWSRSYFHFIFKTFLSFLFSLFARVTRKEKRNNGIQVTFTFAHCAWLYTRHFAAGTTCPTPAIQYNANCIHTCVNTMLNLRRRLGAIVDI